MNTNTSLKNLLPIQTNTLDEETIPTVNARDLHAFLEVGKDFSTWIKNRIAKFGFVEGQDFVYVECLSSPNLGSSKSRAQRTIEYHLTLDMAKELAMVERTPRGKEARQYFIACEKEYRRPVAGETTLPTVSPAQAPRTIRERFLKGLDYDLVLSELHFLIALNKAGPGMHENQAFLAAVCQTEAMLGIELRPLFAPEALALESPNRCAELRPTDIARRFGVIRRDGKEDPAAVNRLLADLGFQTHTPRETLSWTPTEKGWPFAVVKDVPHKTAHLGRPVRQLFWKDSLLEIVGNDLERLGRTRVQTHSGQQMLLTVQ